MSEYIGWLDEDWNIVLDQSQEIVRCRDCKCMHVWDVSSIYCNHNHDSMFCSRFVDGMRMVVEPDGFCAWGEREVVDE